MLKNLEVTILGFSIVMLVMAAITLILMLLPYILGTKKRETKKNKDKDEKNHQEHIEINNISKTNDNTELIAVITAALNAYTRHENKNIRVVSFKRIGDNSPSWNMSSRISN